MEKMVKPQKLQKGDMIGVIAPSSPTKKPEDIDKALEKLRSYGFQVKEGKHLRKRDGYLAGSDKERIEDLHAMFLDKTVKGIVCLKGGYGTPRILGQLDEKVFQDNPKVFAGYSDVTSLHVYLNQKANLVTFHGPMPASDMIYTYSDFSHASWLEAISSDKVIGTLKNPDNEPLETIYDGVAEGKLVGGNLTLLSLSLGTPYEIDTKGKILFIEDVHEPPYRIDGYLMHLKNAGKFEECAGIILGSWSKCVSDTREQDRPLRQVFEEILVPCKKPILLNLRAGHCEPALTLPMGVNVHLDATRGVVNVLENACVSM